MTNKQKWEDYSTNTIRLKVEGGYIYDINNPIAGHSSTCFVPDVDLQRYQSHLRDAYNQGFKDGQEESKCIHIKKDIPNCS